jgi:hypothetical protein
MARPSKCSSEREQALLVAIRAGNTRRAACAYAGISEDSLERWAKRSAGFAEGLTRAEAEAEVSLVAIIRKAAETDWRAAAHLLACRRPEDWSPRARVDVDLTMRRARELAAELDLDADELVAEAERIARLVR